MSDNKNVDNSPEKGSLDDSEPNIAVSSSEVSNVTESVKTSKTHLRISSSSERQIKFERAQRCLENAALVSKRIKEHRKATAELLGRPFEEDDGGDTASEMASTMSERTGYSAATDTSTTLSVQDALNIPGISESLANTLKQKELLMERIKQYKEISKRPIIKTSPISRRESRDSRSDIKKITDNNDLVQLQNTIKEKENALSIIQVKMKAMETTILDLQEKINEKDQIIEAKNKATTLISDSLSKKEKDTLILLEDTKQQMTKMQENFVSMESEWKEEKQRLLKEIEAKDEKINSLEEANTILENSRFEISIAHSKLAEELDIKNKEILDLQERIDKLSESHTQESTQKEKEDVDEEKGSREIAGMVELTKKIELLEQLNCQIRQTNKELENKLASMNPDVKSSTTSSPSKKGSPLPIRKGGRNTASKLKSPWSHISSESLPHDTEKKPNKNDIVKLEMLVQSLNKDILEKEYIISQKDTIISELQSANVQKEANIEIKTQKTSALNMVDIGVCTEITEIPQSVKATTVVGDQGFATEEKFDVPVDTKDYEEKFKNAQEQIITLNNEIDAANKNMIKVKSNHKLKLKQMQKTIDNFSKISDTNAEIIKLNEELHQLTQKVAELEEEKGNLQLHLVDYDSGRLTESDIYKKMVEMENLAETRLKAISVLETQKFDLVQELHVLQQKNVEMEDKLADMSQLQNEQVCSEMKSVQLEEQIDELTASRRELELIIENLKLDKEQLNGTIKLLQDEKEEMNQKLEHYIQENIELTDKLEKLSAEKVSSAESIEIVESLTTQEKLELEEYNKGMIENKIDSHIEDFKETVPEKCNESIEKLVEESAELNRKIELFTQERQEVMEKMTKISVENETLQKEIVELKNQSATMQKNIEILSNEKRELQTLNNELNSQLEELKRERIEVMKESVEIVKPTSVEETAEGIPGEAQQDDKLAGDKGVNRNKSVKQLTKEILKLKNTIKEREAEIADCQMRILSLEEQQQKQSDIIQCSASHESKLKLLRDENSQLKDELDVLKKDKQSEHCLLQLKGENELLQQEIHKIQQEYSITISTREARIQELENLLLEYEKQIFTYGNTLQQKDKDVVEYINQITKLNDVSQKLKSTIELLEEEKAKDQNVELVKTLNKQISAYQKKMIEFEEKLGILKEENAQLLTVKSALENKNMNLDTELKKLQEIFTEKQNLIKDLQAQQQKHADEMSNVILQTKERDEEIHEIKLQLRKESIENEKLRTSLSETNRNAEEGIRELVEIKEKINKVVVEKDQINEQYNEIEIKNKELLEKLKKFAINIKKKSTRCTELENQLIETQKHLEAKNEHLEQLLIQVDTLPALQEKLKHAEEELNRLQSQKVTLEQQKSRSVTQLQTKIKALDEQLVQSNEEISKFKDSLDVSHKELHFVREENVILKSQIETLNKKIVEYEIEQKNNINLVTKISSLETEINQKQIQITELLQQLEIHEQKQSQVQFGYDAKVQERDLYIESLETEISKYKQRICRLEESISVMEDRRHFLESKADQLGSQLQEKQKSYNEYTNQEDELVNRLANLMDHDRVVEKQLHEIESENKELQYKIQHISEENQRLRKSLSDIQDHCNTLVEKASRTDLAESEVIKYQTQLREIETHLKRITHEHQTLLMEKKQTIEDLESEFNTQIENAIKDKKALSEKYEKVNEHVAQLELKLQEYRSNIQNLNINLEELTRINQELIEKSENKEQTTMQDYTEQYINEINKLNSVINNKNEEIYELNNNIQTLHSNNSTMMSNLESKVTELTTKLQHSSLEIDNLIKEINSVKHNNDQLQTLLSQKDEQIKQIIEKKKVTFEMNIPKTEGMIISSTIEAIGEEPKKNDITSIESQIVPYDVALSCPKITHAPMKISEQTQKQSTEKSGSSEGIIEPEIVPKKAYLCYKEEDVVQEGDPFNSDEGWGLGECEEIEYVTPGLSHLNKQIEQLKQDNEALKTDFDTSNTKLLKALKKLKELKTKNDMLTNELRISKQISQTSFLDTAIEDELKNNIQELEKKIEELNADLSKEKREKEALRKQNEVFNNANDRLTEMKEKLDNEIELWKFKFKEANDKMSILQWDADTKESPEHKTILTKPNFKDTQLKDEIIKLEKENDELQMMNDQLTSQNKQFFSQQTNLKEELNNLKKELQQQQFTSENCETHIQRLSELQNINKELLKNSEILKEKLQNIESCYNEEVQKCEQLNIKLKEVSENNTELTDKIKKLEEEIESLKMIESENKNKIFSLTSELEDIKSKMLYLEEQQIMNKLPAVDSLALTEKLSSMEKHCLQLKIDADDANKKIKQFEAENQELIEKSKEYIKQITELNSKMQNLNDENDQLLSTVAELRSSVSTAVDQRGFEIAELWKQHLAQREADFQKTEHELRSQLIAFESKYEQLLDNVQSSSQEETNKLVMTEQVSSLQNKLQDKEEHIHNLQDKYADVINQLDMLRSEMEDEKLMHENKLLAQQEEYEKQIQQLTEKNHQYSENYEQTFKNIQIELVATKTANDELNRQAEDLQNKLKESEAKVLDLTNQIRLKDSEIYQRTHDFTISFAQRNEEFENVRKHLLEYEKKVEDLSYEKESELAVLRLKMHEHNEYYEKMQKEFESEKTNLTDLLNTKIIECTNLNKQITDLNQILEEHSSRAIEMQTALENQELEIVTLKDEISSLQDIVKSSNRKIQKHVTFASNTKLNTDEEKSEGTLNKELLDAVPRAELDLALYMLHQRDVRCEELTMELTQLLEERDTLQLRLSDSLRSNEEFKSRCKSAGLDSSINSSQETISELPSFTIEKEQQFVDTHRGQTSRSSSISDADGEKPKLQAKLSELRSVKHSRDVRLRQDSEQRQLGMRLLQRDVANLPPEAVDQLAQAHHTLSRDSQSTSTVLLNWLRGKSTPKVVHM